jgi:hypothetical protein
LNIDIAQWLADFERNDFREVFGGIKVNENGESDIIRN